MTDNALKCMFNGGTLPMGYVIDAEQHFQIDPVTAPYILDAFKQYDEGATMTQIRDWLNEQGMKNTRGNPLTYNSVQHLLKNRRYIGEYQYRDILIPDGIPAIVPKDLFDRVQAKMEKNKKAPARHKAEDDYLLTTKLFCGYCGAYLCGESGTSRTGVVHHYYKCVSVKKKRKECHKKPVKKGWIEDLVVSETMKMIMDDDAIEAIVSMLMELQEQDNTNIPLYERQLQETNTKIRNLINAIQQGVLTKSTKESLEELEAQEACRLTGLAAVADDSGLCVDALNGAPGIYSARYSGEGDDGNNQKLLRQLAGVPAEKRTGRYICAISCIFPDQTELTAEGICEGKIGYALSGDHGFGYDPLFYVGERSFGQYGDEEKDKISHRGKALRLFCEKLKEYQAKND